jgi:lipopolysaccharide export LptBFGC system permease protein LptF
MSHVCRDLFLMLSRFRLPNLSGVCFRSPSTLLATGVVVLVVAFANIFTIIQPVIDSGDWNSALWMVGGPIFFSLLALGIYENYRRRMASGALVMES